MKSFFTVFMFAAFLTFRSEAQTVTAGTQGVTVAPATALTVTPPPTITAAPWIASGSPPMTIGPGTPWETLPNVSLLTLSQTLIALQTNVEQILPLVAAFNDNVDLIITNPAPNQAVNLATNHITSVAASTAVSTGTVFNTNAIFTWSSPTGAIVPTGTPAPVVPISRETLRALQIVQSDLERLLPLLYQLNEGSANALGTLPNQSGVVLNP